MAARRLADRLALLLFISVAGPAAAERATKHDPVTAACLWDKMAESDKKVLIDASDHMLPMSIFYSSAMEDVDTFTLTRICNPEWDRDPETHVWTLQYSVVTHVALARLKNIASQADLDLAWDRNPQPRGALTSEFAKSWKAGQPLTATQAEKVFDEVRTIWARMGRTPSEPLAINSPEMAALSYWATKAVDAVAADAPKASSGDPERNVQNSRNP